MSQKETKREKDLPLTPMKDKGTNHEMSGKTSLKATEFRPIKLEQIESPAEKANKVEDLRFLRKKTAIFSKIKHSRSRSRSRGRDDSHTKKMPYNTNNKYGRNNQSEKNSYNTHQRVSYKPMKGGLKGWLCENDRCKGINFLSRFDCFKCGLSIPQNPFYTDLPSRDNFNKKEYNDTPPQKKKNNYQTNSLPYNPIRGSTLHNDKHKPYFYLPKLEPIESEFSYPEITSAIQLLSKAKQAKNDDEVLQLIKKINH